jgi:mycofactocin precursor
VPLSVSSARGTAGEEDDAMDENEELVEETLVEEVSIDGMCGVY